MRAVRMPSSTETLGEETTAQGTWWVASLGGTGLDEGQVQAVADALKGATVRL